MHRDSQRKETPSNKATAPDLEDLNTRIDKAIERMNALRKDYRFLSGHPRSSQQG